MKNFKKMLKQPNLGTLSMVLILCLGIPEVILACPHPCACYVPSEVHCTFRSLAAVPTRISKHVERINLGFNSIQAISESSFAGLSKLELLMLHGNDIQNIPNGALKDLSSLQVFKISYNKLQVITGQTLQGLFNLMRLHLDHNRIEFIHPNAFHGLISLRLLHLEGNLLQQLHPSTFSTFLILDYFRMSTIKHLYLSENAIRTLPRGIFERMPLLENIYLHGNPWSCDCRLKWFLEWSEKSAGIVKCKKDKAYEEGQLCPKCTFPKQFQKQDIQNVKEISCTKPIIQSPLKQSISLNKNELEKEDDTSELLMEEFQRSPWNITLNMTDEHRNTVNLKCEIKKPTDSTKIQWNQISHEIVVNGTVSLDLECHMNRENYENLWKLIAYYSEVPVKLKREHVLSREPKLSYHYRQGSDYNAPYYTGVKGRILAEPAWVMQPLIYIQLNRHQSTGKKVVLSFSSQVSQTLQPHENKQQRSSWVMIEQDQHTRVAQTVVEGSDAQLSCNVKASESPSIKWVLPDGTKLKAPFRMEGRRFSVLSSGQLIIRSVAYADSGVYHCVAQVRDDVDAVAYRVLVQPTIIQQVDSELTKIEKNVGDSILLPCTAVAIPDALLSWILPSSQIVNDLSNSSNGYLLENGTLLIPYSHISDSGYYRCVAINQQGSDEVVVKVTVNKMVSDRSSKRVKFKKQPGSRTSVKARAQVIGDDEGSGDKEIYGMPSKKIHLKDYELSLKQKSDGISHVQVKTNKKGKRKMKLWKGIVRTEEINVAEGRRVFESRRRIHMANKQINPQHWANILAKVRGKNLPRLTTTAIAIVSTTPEIPFPHWTTRSPPPVSSLPPTSAMEINGEESSADTSHLDEANLFSVMVPSVISMWNYSQDQILSTAMHVEHEASKMAEHPTNVAQDIQISPTIQTQPWHHSDLSTDQSKLAEPKRMDNFDGEISKISKKEVVTQSTLIVSNSEKATPYPYSDVSVKDPVLAKTQKNETSKHLQPKSMTNISNFAINFTHAQINSSAIIVPSASQAIHFAPKEHASAEHLQLIPFNPPRGSKNLVFASVHPQKTKSSSTIQSTVHPLKKKEWMLTAATTNKPTTAATITAYERKMTASEPPISHHSRRRPYGRRRLRPNRFKRPKPIPPTAFNVKEITFAQKISKIDSITQTMQGFMARHQKPEDEIQKVSSSSSTSMTTLQKSTKAQDTIAASDVHLSTSLPKTPLTLSSIIKDQKGQMVILTYDSMTTSLPKQLHLSHSPEYATAADKLIIGYNEVTDTPTTSISGESSASPSGLSSSMIPQLEEKADFVSSASTKVIDSRVAQSRPATLQYLSVSKMGHPETLPSLEELQNFSEYLIKTTVEPFSHQGEKMTTSHHSSVSDHTSIPTEMNQTLDPWQNKTPILPTSRYSKGITSQFHDRDDQTAIYITEKKYPPVVSISMITTLPPLTPSSLNSSYDSSTKKNHTSVQLTHPDRKMPSVDSIRAKDSSRQNELSTIQQNQGGSRSYSSFSLNPNIPNQSVGKNPGFAPPKYVHVRGTVRPPYLIASGFFHHFVTHQVPLHYTNKPEITAYAAYTTQERKTSTFPTPTAAPLYRPKMPTPGRSDNQDEIRHNIHSKVFVSNYLPETRDKPGRTINHTIPYLHNVRTPSLINRTRVFQHLGVNSKPPVPNPPVPVNPTEKTFLSLTRKIMHSTSLKATAIPVPPISLDTIPAAGTIIPTFTTPKIKSQISSTLQSSSGIYYNNPNLLFVPKLDRIKVFNSSIAQPSVPLRPQGEKPKIITKISNSLSVLAESDAVIPCDATGEPKPFFSWRKISTGAMMTAKTKMQRFEVLKNGTFLIHNVQLQDRGQYLCTAENPHGTDKIIVLLTVIAQQPKMLGSRFTDVTVYFGEKVTMDCQATGIPKPHISWIFPNRKIFQTVSTTEGRVMLYENRTLVLKDTNFSDRGIYKCIASNAAGADSIAVRLHIAALPPIIEQQKEENVSLNVGQSVSIHCSAKAAPPPGIRWVLFDGTQIRTSQFVHGNLFVFPNGTLYIRNVLPKDSGRYECIATNMVGAARRTVQVQVKKQSTNAKITGSSPQRTDVTYGSTLRLDCSASGDPWPWILWRLPSKRMVDSLQSWDSRIKVLGNGTLVVHSVTDKDAGDYLCVARNKIGDDYVVLKVNVMMKPAKIEHKNENNHKVIYGGDLKVDCVATGLPNPEISWSLPDGSMINTFMQSDDSGSRAKRYVVFDNGTLYFNEVGLREEGDYTCYAENQIGKDEMKVRVKVVAEPPTIRNKTYVVLNTPYGDAVSVGCEAKGEPTPKVIWLSPSNRPIPVLSDKYQVYIDGTLLIQKAQRSDSGNYTCVARNSAGEDRKIVWIHVNVQPPKINGHPSTITSVREMALKDSRKFIDCKAEGIPSPRVMWAFPEGVILPAPYYGNRITVHRNGTLDIRGVRHTDAVQLVCIGRNEGGEARLVVQLQVVNHVEKPVFGDPVTERITATAGHSINLNCSVHGTPPPRTAWILPNGTELLKSSHLQRFYHKRDGILHISALSAADAGTYRCTARNPGGYAERVVFLKVGVKPEISNHYNNLVSIINGETLQLHCITQPGQRAHVTWTLPNGMVLDGPQVIGRFSLLENGSLIVREASVFDRGTYLCKAATDYGSSFMNVPVIVIAYPPRITSEPAPVIYARPGNTVKLNCMAIGIPKAEITWELPEKLHLTTGAQSRLYGNKFLHPQGSLIIQQATQRDAGFYKCTAKNILGSDSKATYIHIF